jgi:hypothetical protein
LLLAWVNVDHSLIKRDENILLEVHKPGIDEIILSRSYAGHDQQYKMIPAAGSGLFYILFYSFFYLKFFRL